MGQTIDYGKDARQKMYKGVKTVNDAVKVTLGPMGKCVIINALYPPFYEGIRKPLQLSKDGYRVAKSINLLDTTEYIGQKLIQEAAQKTVDEAGDATSTTCILMEAMVRIGLECIDNGANSQDLKKGMDYAVDQVVSSIKEMAIPVNDDSSKIKEIATVSANNDETIGAIIAEAFSKVGKDGVINIDESKRPETEIKVTEGFKIDRGWVSPYFLTNKEKETVEYENARILLYDKRITHHTQVLTALEAVLKKGQPLLIICEDAVEEGLATLVFNNVQGRVKCCVVKTPFGANKDEQMEDIAIVTGAMYITDLKGTTIKETTDAHLGFAKKVIVSKDDTVIIGGNTSEAELETLLNELKMNLAQKKTEEERSPIEKRIAKLTSSIAIINVGATTETELTEKMDRFDDAVRATKAALAEGYVAGGGTAFLRVNPVQTTGENNKDYNLGISIINDVMKVPIVQLCENSGINASDILEKVKCSTGNIGYNAKSNVVEDLVQSGIIDAVKVIRCALQNAVSAAGNLLITEAIISDTQN